MRSLVLAIALAPFAMHCRRQASTDAIDASLPPAIDVPRQSARLDAGVRTARDEENAVRSQALAVAWRDLQPSDAPCPVPLPLDDVTAIVDGRAMAGPHRAGTHDTVVILDARSPQSSVARIYVFDRAAREMVCGGTMDVNGNELLGTALRRASIRALVPRTSPAPAIRPFASDG